MNKERLMELAGISSNMSNPSHEVASDIPDNKVEPPANVQTGDDSFDDKDWDREDKGIERTLDNILPQIKTLAMKGMLSKDIEEAHDALDNILDLLGMYDEGDE